MENKAHAMAAGIFVALLTALVLGLAAWLTRDSGVRDTYEISTRESVTGLQAQAPVRFRGVDVGKVSAVGFDPKSPGAVLVRLQVDREAPVTTDTFATLSYQGVTGLAFIQLADDGSPGARLVPNEDDPPNIPLRPGLLAKLEDRGEAILDKVEEVTLRINQVLGEQNQRHLTQALENTGRAAETVARLALTLDTTVRRRLDPVLAEAGTTMRSMQRTADEVGRTAAAFGRTADDFNAMAQRLNASGGPVDRISESADSLALALDVFGRSTLPRVNRMADETIDTVRALRGAIDDISDNPQALLYGRGKPRPGPGEPGFPAGASR